MSAWKVLILALPLLLAACAASASPPILRLATTTSTADSGLLEALLPDFEAQHGVRVEVIAVGTGQALALGERGDADVLLIHAREQEEAFVEAGHGLFRRGVMYNDFVIVGPQEDPAAIRGMARAAEAFAAIARREVPFASRGDDSGTHLREQAIWELAAVKVSPSLPWYRSLGQGMGETLITANEMGAYTLTDRGTFLSMAGRLPGLTLLVGGATLAENEDDLLLNPYGVIPLDPEQHPGTSAELAGSFVEWLLSPEIQARIGRFGADRYGQPLFYPGQP